MRIRDISVGGGAPLLLISGLNVLESLDVALACADGVAAIAERHGLPAVFKASYDKANRSSRDSFRGVGLDAGLRILERVKADLEPYGLVEQFPKLEGRQMVMVLAPKKKPPPTGKAKTKVAKPAGDKPKPAPAKAEAKPA